MKQIKQKVKAILTEYPSTRDNENRLVLLVYRHFYGVNSHSAISYIFSLIDDGRLPSIQTIQQYSRQIQAENIDLRGELWEKRQRLQKPVQQDLGYKVK